MENKIDFNWLLLSYPNIAKNNAEFTEVFKSQINQMLKSGGGAEKIFREIEFLELGSVESNTEKPEKFKHEPLRGLWKKHYFIASFIPQNVINHWKMASSTSGKLRGVLRKHLTNPLIKRDPLRVSHEIAESVVAGFRERSLKGKLTGEWIVYGEKDNRRVYLTLAKHTESNSEIYNRIYSSFGEKLKSYIEC